MTALEYTHVDVFAPAPFTGNSLPVFLDAPELSAEQMLRVTQELRHFEAVFLWSTADPATWRARVFDLSGELPFAGHPLLGAAAVLHRAAPAASTGQPRTWRIELAGGRVVSLTTEPAEHGYHAVLDQGTPEFLGTVDQRARVARAFSLDTDQVRDDLPMEVVSIGLRYLIVPVRAGARHGLVTSGQEFTLRQGRFTGRPSTLRVRATGTPDRVDSVLVGGPVAFVGHGAVAVPH